jgi:PAS domain S-box-containing protein
MPENILSTSDSAASQLDSLKAINEQQSKELEELKLGLTHFSELFHHAPVPILEFNFSVSLEKIRSAIGDTSLSDYLDKQPETIKEIGEQCSIREANSRALKFFKAKDLINIRKLFKQQIYHMVTSNEHLFFKSLLAKKKSFQYEDMMYDCAKTPHQVVVRISTQTDNYSSTFVSFEDISEIKQVQSELEGSVRARTYELEKANKELRNEIHSREQIARDLRQSEARYRQLNAIYPVGIFHTDKEGRNTYINSKACEIQGVKVNEARNYGWSKNIHPDDKDRVLSTWKNGVKYGIPINIDYRFVHDGKVIWVNGQTVPEYDERGGVAGYVGILADITKQREAEEQIKQNQIEIAHFSRLNSMGEVASGIAHELNQPLTAIMNYASGIKRRLSEYQDKLPKGVLEAIDRTIAQASRAGEVIHHLKDFLRKGALSKSKTDINAAVSDVLTFINRPIDNANINIKLKLDKKLPIVYAGKIHIEQVIINMINNGIDAIEEAKCEKRNITISTGVVDTDYIRISIEDTGPGIADELIDNIFNPFVTTKEEGMGIGLSLCYNIVDKHGGKITVSSQMGKGTIFHIMLPIK